MTDSITASHLKTNTRVNPFGIDTATPEFAWRLETSAPNATQSAYHVQVSIAERFATGDDLIWDSGQVISDAQFGVRYSGGALESARRYWWRVRVWDGAGMAGPWSDAVWFEIAILDPARWNPGVKWISGAPPDSRKNSAALYLRGALNLPASVKRGRAYVSALGWYRFFVNGQDLTGNALVPRWTPFDHIVEYQTYDVTEQFRAGANIIGIAVGDGRYRGSSGFANLRRRYGDRLAGFAQIELELADGGVVTFVTDERWQAGPGRILSSDTKNGERVDARISDADWLGAPEPPARFAPAQALPATPHVTRMLVAEEVGRVQEVQRLPGQIKRAPSGKQIVDFGQNFAGVPRVRLAGKAGARVRIVCSELLTKEGELNTSYLEGMSKSRERGFQTDEVILDGSELWYQPWFTIHGFRYAEVDGLDYDLTPADVEGIVLSSELEAVGTFECSDQRLNQLHHNVFWSLRSNFTDTPTDCPTRERSGWTGDIQTFAPAATTFVDAQAFLRRYLRNLALEQLPNGGIPSIIPSESSTFTGRTAFVRVASAATGWADAAILLPWTLYRYYGDRTILERQYDSMRRWLTLVERNAQKQPGWRRAVGKRVNGKLERYIVSGGFHFGEWLRPGEKPTTMFRDAIFPRGVVATAYYAYSARLLAEIATILGRDDDAKRYADLAAHVREAWQAAFVYEDGRIGEDKQDDYVRALTFDLAPPEQRAVAFARLVTLIEQNGDHLGTGFLSTPMLLPTLVANGRADIAYRLLMQTTNPSWLYQVEHGATTIWETWEGYDDNGNAKSSHNHYAFGAVAAWLQEGVAGLSPAEPGYRRIYIAPTIGGGLTHASATLMTPFGLARSAWRLEGSRVRLDVTAPPGTRAEVHLGDGRAEEVGSGTHQYTWTMGGAGA